MQRSNEERARAWLRGMPLWGDASNVSGDAYRRQLVPSLTALLAEAEERGRTEAIEACARFLEAGGRAYEANEVRKADWLSEGLPLHVQADIAQAAHAFCSDWGIDSQPPRDDLEDLLTSVHAEATEAERERIVGIVEERAENGEPVAKLVRAVRRRGNDQTSGNAAEPSAPKACSRPPCCHD